MHLMWIRGNRELLINDFLRNVLTIDEKFTVLRANVTPLVNASNIVAKLGNRSTNVENVPVSIYSRHRKDSDEQTVCH